MRLSDEEIKAIKHVAREVFGKNVTVTLFGSRADNARRGGDIDLHLDVDDDKCTLENELRFELGLLKALSDRKIDIVLHKHSDTLKPIDETAIQTGVKL